ncbi:MAG: UDP-4-amino-4,6-dideoxy-N-acetyl-beta-L-altrosamine transaminase [Pseudomonadota bacterium]|jgi:UDP-4-amino-4,6-dideoxy-N-acetyl-beta-L-altrosamine transaminase
MSPSSGFLPYGRQCIEDDDIAAVVAALRQDAITTGPSVDAFERAVADAVGASHCVAISNGTAALHAAVHAAGVGPGDRVAVPAITFLATANCARYVGAEPVFVDVDAETGLMDPADLQRVLAEGPVRAVIPVHLTGRSVDLAAIGALAADAGAVLIEDAAHALGARYRGRPIGGAGGGAMATFSFHPVKHVTTAEGGAITTEDAGLAAAMRRFRSHGMTKDPAELRTPSPGPWYYEAHESGFNYRITDLQCALGVSQMAKLDRFLARRRALVRRYDALLTDLPFVRPNGRGPDGADGVDDSAWHLYAVRIDFDAAGRSRKDVMEALAARGIGTQVHYIPLPEQPVFVDRGAPPMSRFPGAAAYYAQTLSLPLYPLMQDDDPDRVVAALREVVGA